MKRRIFIVITILSLSTVIQAALSYKTYSVIDGMPNSTVKAICQDSLGYIWFGTRNGLCRFDGYQFRTYYYDTKKENTVSSNDITCFTKDKLGRIWIGTFNWITLFDPFTEKYIELDLSYPEENFPQGVVTNIWIDAAGHVWISSKTGLYVIKKEKVLAIESLKGAYINSMNAVDSENLLVEIMGKGTALFNITDNRLTYTDETKARPLIYKIYRDKQGKTWLGANSNHIYEYVPRDNSLVRVNINIPANFQFDNEQIHDIMEYNDSIIIFGTDNGLLAINKYTLNYLSDIIPGSNTNLLSNHRIMCLFNDNQDAIWVGTFNKGAKYLNPGRYHFNFYDLGHDNKTPIGIVGNLAEKDGVLWVGHEQGISSIDMITGKITHVELESQLQIKHKKPELFFLFHDEADILYFYLLNRGLYAFDTKTRRIIKRINIPPASQVRSMARDKTGKIWMAEEELSVYDPVSDDINSFLSTNINNITSFMLTQDLLQKHNGNMLVGTRTNGVWEYTYDEQNKNKYSVANQLNYEELKNKNINILFEDSKHDLWLGTYGSGLFHFDVAKKKYTRYTIENGLAHNLICGIIEDENTHDIWVTTINAVSKINRKSGKIINYTNKMGFPLEEVSQKSFLKASNGLYYIGGSNGLASFNPKLFHENATLPVVIISSIESLNQEGNGHKYRFNNVVDLQKVALPFQNSSLSIRFSSLNYFSPQGDRYSYKLEGLDEDWKTTERNEVVYTNLREGKYTFRIKASDSEGNWANNITEINITIHPPFWRTIWAKAFYLLIISGIIYFIFQFFYQRKTAKYKQQINQIEKNNIERYYQMKLELFTEFSHELRTPLTLITGPAEDIVKDETLPSKLNYSANLIYKNAHRLLLLVNQLMDVRKMEHGAMMLKVSPVDINTFLSEQIESFRELVKKKEVNLLYQNRYWGKNVWFDTEFMEKVIFNLLSNAIKYTQKGGEIIITSKEKDNSLLISVHDNGEGIAKENLENIFKPFFQVKQGNRDGFSGSGLGLSLAKYIVGLHGGNIRVESALGQGAEFFVELPLGTNHFDSSHTEIVPVRKAQTETSTPGYPDTNTGLFPEKLSPDNKTWILIAEDDEELRQYIVSQISGDYSVFEAADGKEAFALAIEKIPDLIISDIMMPGMDGIEFCKNIKENLSTAHVPVILLTAKVMNESIREGYEALADDYIVKPFNSILLKVRIKNLIDNRIQLRKIFKNQLSTVDVSALDMASTDPFIKKLFEIVENRIDDSKLSISYIASELGVSRAQFFRKIKAVSDLSPNKLILNIRMKMAVAYLKTKAYTIAEVAYKVGFTDPAYFSKTFKNIFDVTPSDFMKGEVKDNV